MNANFRSGTRVLGEGAATRRWIVAVAMVAGCGGGDAGSASDAGSTGTGTGTASPTSTNATTGEVTTGEVTTGGATTGEATTGGATTGGATTGEATTGEATTGEVAESTTEPGTTGVGDTESTGTTGLDTTGEPGLQLPWDWFAGLDHGVRNDDYGLGHFGAPRKNYPHSGIDFLLPVGAELRSPCAGVYLADYDGGYGNWVQVICEVPATHTQGQTVYASMLYAHLDAAAVKTTGIDPAKAGVVAQGQLLGTNGKSGNANVPGLNSHLHFEVALHGSALAGLQETHASGANHDTPAAAALRAGFMAYCLGPTGFAPKSSPLHYGRRIDPFIFMACLSGEKPPLTKSPLQPLDAWSAYYGALTFDVDVGIQP